MEVRIERRKTSERNISNEGNEEISKENEKGKIEYKQ